MLYSQSSHSLQHRVLTKIYERNRNNIIKSCKIAKLEFLKYPNHKTAICILSRVENPDVVVAYTYGGLTPHHFQYNTQGQIVDNTLKFHQFTWEWMEHWLNQGVAVAIFDVPDYFTIPDSTISWVSSFYRLSDDRRREAKQMLDLLSEQFPDAKLNWFGLSYGALDAAMISTENTQLHKIVSASGTWHRIADVDEFHQGGRLDWYDVTKATKPVLIVMHEKEVFDHARDQMSKTDSILVTNDVNAADGHFFRQRQDLVVAAICDWYRDKPIPKEIK